MKKVKTIIGMIIVLTAAFFYAHIAKANAIYDRDVDSSEYIGTGVFAEKLEQEFVCREDTLDGISAKCQLQGDAAGTAVKLTLIDNASGNIAAESELKAEEIKNSKFNCFSFDTVDNCRGNSYTVRLKSVDENLEENRGIGFVYQPATMKDTKLEIGTHETEGTLIIKTITDRFDIETFCVLLIFVVYIVIFIKFLYKLFK